MNLIMNCARLLALLMPGLLTVPGLADDGNGAGFLCFGYPCPDFGHGDAFNLANHLRPGSVIVFPLFISNSGNTEECGTGNILVNRVCLPQTEIELGATCPTRFTVPGPVLLPGGLLGQDQSEAHFPCVEHQPVRVRFRWVCPGIQDFEHKSICRTTGFDVHLTVNGKVVFTANRFLLPDTNQVHVPAAPCDKGYLIGWVIDAAGRPIKYDGLIGEAIIRMSGTAAAAYRGITIQAKGTTTPGDPIDLIDDPLSLMPPGLPFFGDLAAAEDLVGSDLVKKNRYRLVTGQVTGDVTFDRPGSKGSGFGVSSSLILLTLDVRSNSRNFPTRVTLDFWNGSERKLSPSPSVEFVCWGEFRLSDIDVHLTQAFMRTRKGIVQSDEAIKLGVPGISDVPGNTTLLGLVETNEIPAERPVARSYIVELYNNGIRYWSTAFFP